MKKIINIILICVLFCSIFIGLNSVSATDGDKKWEYNVPFTIISSPSIGADGTIYLGSSDSNLYAINPDGTKKWTFPAGSQVRSSPAIGTDGTIYFGTHAGKVYAVNPNGAKKWEVSTSETIYSSPAIGSDGTIYIGSRKSDYSNGTLHAIASDGTYKWGYITGGQGIDISSPAIGPDGTIYVGGNHELYAVKPDGSEKWKCTIFNLNSKSSPVVGKDGTIYIAGQNSNQLHAVNPNGTTKWNSSLGGMISASPAIGSDGTIYIGVADGVGGLCAVNPTNGIIKWKLTTIPKIYYSSAAIGPDNKIYVGAGNDLYAISPEGAVLWNFPTSNGIWSSPAIGSDGTIYINSFDDKLYAIQSNSKWTEKDNAYIMNVYANSPWPKFGQNNFNLHRLIPAPSTVNKSLPMEWILKILKGNQEE
ncbi:MAG TPA: PQQ-binding-like beta-propeller repeat protein [Methanofastidiosum sp.]|nr:PQQ-binding-like beta-propeller repeat protein [Methanofastidiosum sp.]HQK63384.1 PQQ-binding-like beta-propeller repeat protein [Methanofastidiosum sp.]HQQ48663.1 PQQ-binding-like beta-propeller repeat protein [Methanofastidiosum sp.]